MFALRICTTASSSTPFLRLWLLLFTPAILAAAEARPDPQLTIPFCHQAPVLDGKLAPGEWQYAAAISMLEAYPIYEPRVMRKEQAVFYVCRDAQNLYVAMESGDSNTDAIIAACPTHDDRGIFGGDCLELMVGPGAGKEIEKYDFPIYYLGINAIGTVWDSKMVPRLAEDHVYWESGVQVANSIDGTHWISELCLPLKSISNVLPADGTVWRMNFIRTFPGYTAWTGWSTAGGQSLNDPKVGGDVTFDRQAPAVRLLSVTDLADGKLGVKMEVANGTDTARQVTLRLACSGQQAADGPSTPVGTDAKEVTAKPGEIVSVTLGNGQTLLPLNQVTLEATDPAGRRLFFIQRQVTNPVLRMTKRPAPKVPLVSIFPRFLPSLERLSVIMDYTAWARKTGYTGDGIRAEIRVFPKGGEKGEAVISGDFSAFGDCRGTWRHPTQDLAEGEYTVKVKVTAKSGEVLEDYDDWFEKRTFDWMVHKRGIGEAAPAPYTPLEVAGREVRSWGRVYRFNAAGLPRGISSQGKQLLTGEAALEAQIGGRQARLKVAKTFAVTAKTPGKVHGKSELIGGNLRIELESVTEYDGFTLFRMTYGPVTGAVTIDRLRLRIPLNGKYAKFYSAAGDTVGTTIPADVLPQRQGKVYDSMNDTRAVVVSPTFATLFWVADHDISFCYAADNDKGWLIRDDAPAIEAYREGDDLVLWLNFVDKTFTLTAPRTLEFALQAGPTKPRPEGWRGIQNLTNNGADPKDAPQTVIQIGGSGDTLAGGTHFIYPGSTPEQRQKSKEKIDRILAGGGKAVVGYNFWGNIPKGLAETRVFRGEWGVTRQQWDATTQVREWEWKNRFYGDNQDLYIILGVQAVPSYVDFLAFALDETFRYTALAGHYDDVGYPHPLYDEELGYGFIREDGKRIYSSGLWIYRERWKRANYVSFQHDRPNFLEDSQHVHAHFMPAYNFIGLWTPCEHGYYNPFKGQDNLDFYRSLDRYAAFNPARQFGQIPMVGMASPEGWGKDGDPAVFARDTRCMMMLAMLNDHDVGSFGARDPKVVIGLRHARNIFRPWEKEVSFLGYWESRPLLKTDADELQVAAYRRPDSILLIIGNVGDQALTATVEPVWSKLKLDPKGLEAVNAETGEAIPLTAGRSKTGMQISLNRHDCRLILVSPPGRFQVR